VGDQPFSCLDTGWAAVTPYARVIWWALNRLRPYQKAPSLQQGGAKGVPGLATVAMAAGATAPATVAREYTPFEVQHIQAACTLTPNVYAAELSKVFEWMLEEGYTKICTQGVVRKLLVPDKDDNFNAIHVLVTEEIAKDFKNLDFNMSPEYFPFHGDTCIIGPGQSTTLSSRPLRRSGRQLDA
jgi:hypothetical protein